MTSIAEIHKRFGYPRVYTTRVRIDPNDGGPAFETVWEIVAYKPGEFTDKYNREVENIKQPTLYTGEPPATVIHIETKEHRSTHDLEIPF